MSAQQATRMRTKIMFEPNTPVAVSLEFPSQEGQLQESRLGGAAEYRYFLHDDKIMWLPEAAHAQLAGAIATNPDSGTFSITKLKAANGRVSWLVEQHAEEPIAAQLEKSITNAKNTRESQARAELAPPPPLSRTPQQQRTGQVEPEPGQVREAAEAGRRITPQAARLTAALCSAIDAAYEAETYARSRGMQLHFSSSDIRALANCSEIGEQR